MNSTPSNPGSPHHNPETVFVGERQHFTDPPGGVPLDDPEVRERERLRRAKLESEVPPSDETEPQSR